MNKERTLQTVSIVTEIYQHSGTTRLVFVPVVPKPDPEYLAWKRKRRKMKRKVAKALVILEQFLDKAAAIVTRLLYRGIMCIGCLTVIFVVCRTMRLF